MLNIRNLRDSIKTAPKVIPGVLALLCLAYLPASGARAVNLAEATAGVEQTATEDNLWDRIAGQLTLQTLENPRIAAERSWYEGNPEYLRRVSQRASPYLYYVVNEIDSRGLPMELALLPVMESAYDPFAYSHGRAAGLWQIIPGTGRELGLAQNWWYDGRRDIRASTAAALDYLETLNQRFDGDWLKALAAYNAGFSRVQRAEQRNRARGRSDDFWSLDLPAETRSYVPRLLALADVVALQATYGQSLTPIPDAPRLAVADTGSQIDLAQAAQLADIDIERLYLLNPGFNQWATAPDGPHELLLPADAAQRFEENIALLDRRQRIQWTRYTVRGGDSLSRIAARFNTEIDVIRQVNKLANNRIIAGDSLVIPTASAPLQSYALSAGQRLAERQEKGAGNRLEVMVRPGDSFWSIARRFDVSTRRLAEWNGMAVRDPIHPGQKLVVWADQAPVIALSKVSLDVPEREPMLRKISYRVRSGDSLARIADKFSLTVADILGWNDRLRDRKTIHPGQRLTLYVDVTQS